MEIKEKYKVKYSKKFLYSICCEILMVNSLGRQKFTTDEEGKKAIITYLNKVKQKTKNVNNDERTNLDLALEWTLITIIKMMDKESTGDLVPILSLAKSAILDGDNDYKFKFVDKNPKEAIYFKIKQ